MRFDFRAQHWRENDKYFAIDLSHIDEDDSEVNELISIMSDYLDVTPITDYLDACKNLIADEKEYKEKLHNAKI